MSQMPEANYKNFQELAVYATARAKISAGRRGHQEFAYWYSIRIWALAHNKKMPGPDDLTRSMLDLQHEAVKFSREGHIGAAAQFYAMAVHVRKMLINRGEQVQRLSLDWLREAADQL